MSDAPVNGLDLFYEEHGAADGRPLLLLHGALSGIGTSFGELLPLVAKERRVVAVELRAHGRSTDLPGPLSFEGFAADVVGLLNHLGVDRADVLGWSMGAGVALQLGIHHATRVGRLVLASGSYHADGLHPGLLDGIADLEPEHLHGSEFHQEYLQTAPDPAGWAGLVGKIKELDAAPLPWTADQVRALASPTLLVLGDADIVTPEHAVEMFRLLGGAVVGDLVPLPACRLAVLPGTSHTGMARRAEWLAPMVTEFLDG